MKTNRLPFPSPQHRALHRVIGGGLSALSLVGLLVAAASGQASAAEAQSKAAALAAAAASQAPSAQASAQIAGVTCQTSKRSIEPKALPADPRLVVYPYDRNALYPINAYIGLYTHLEFDEAEHIKGAYLNDETEFEMKVAKTGSDIMIRPKVQAAVGGLTVITDRRRYEFDLSDISGCTGQTRYQRVSFTYLGGSYEDVGEDDSAAAGATRPRRQALAGGGAGMDDSGLAPLPGMSPLGAGGGKQPTASPNGGDWTIRLDQLHTDYVIEGSSDFTPVSVMDDGRRTIIKFRQNLDLLPVLFAVDVDGNAETVEYRSTGSQFLVNRVFSHGAVLKLGDKEVKIRNRAAKCGWFDSACRSVQARNISGSSSWTSPAGER